MRLSKPSLMRSKGSFSALSSLLAILALSLLNWMFCICLLFNNLKMVWEWHHIELLNCFIDPAFKNIMHGYLIGSKGSKAPPTFTCVFTNYRFRELLLKLSKRPQIQTQSKPVRIRIYPKYSSNLNLIRFIFNQVGSTLKFGMKSNGFFSIRTIWNMIGFG